MNQRPNGGTGLGPGQPAEPAGVYARASIVARGRAEETGVRVIGKRARTRGRILNAAELAFGAAPYRQVRMEDIAYAADVSVAAIYDHFGNKDGLYLALTDRTLDHFAGYIERAFSLDCSPMEQFMTLGELYLRFALEHPGTFPVLAASNVDVQPLNTAQAANAQIEERLKSILDRFERGIQEAIDSGEVDPSHDAHLTARFLWGAWNGVVAVGMRTDRMALTEEEVIACLRLGRRIVHEGLTAPDNRGPDNRSRARLIDPD